MGERSSGESARGVVSEEEEVLLRGTSQDVRDLLGVVSQRGEESERDERKLREREEGDIGGGGITAEEEEEKECVSSRGVEPAESGCGLGGRSLRVNFSGGIGTTEPFLAGIMPADEVARD